MKHTSAQIHAHNMKKYKQYNHARKSFTNPIKFKLKDYIYIGSFFVIVGVTNGNMEKIIYENRIKAYEPLLSPAPHLVTPPRNSINLNSSTNPIPETRQEITPKKSEKTEILAYIVEKFGDSADKAIVMIKTCENSTLDPKRMSPLNIQKNGRRSYDVGIMQINVDENDKNEQERLKDFKYNIDKGFEKFKAGNNSFYFWTCGSKVGDRTYLGE